MRARHQRPVGISQVSKALCGAAVVWLACALCPAIARGSGLASARLEKRVTPNAKLDTLLSADTIFEGPTWVGEGASGYLIFSDVPGNAIKRLAPDGKVSVFVGDIFRGRDKGEAYQSTSSRKFTMLGPNSTTLDRFGRLVYCAFSDGEIVRIEPNGRRTVLASQFAGKHLNAPNDLVYGPDGSLYFTDSRAGTPRGDDQGVPHKGLYRLKFGRVELLSKDIDHPNGVAFSPGGRYLYVTNTLRRNVLRFEVTAGGIANQKVFVDMSGDTRTGGPDGIKVDRRGTVYSTGPGGVWIMSARGDVVGEIKTPAQATNLAFGGPARRTLYVTAMGALYRIRLSA